MEKLSLFAFAALALPFTACRDADPGETDDSAAEVRETPPPPGADARPLRASRSTPIDIDFFDLKAAMVNTDGGSVSFFRANLGSESKLVTIPSSLRSAASEPVSIAIHPTRDHVYVANRATGTLSRIVNYRDTPVLDRELSVGTEPMGIALTPSGGKLYVTDWVEGVVSIVDTDRFQVVRRIPVGGRPFAIAITNNGDRNEFDEKVLVTQFYARPRAGVTLSEGTDDGKEGVVQVIRVGEDHVSAEIPLAPLSACFTGAAGNPPAVITSGCFPNQLMGIAVHTAFGHTRAYVVSTAASPAGPVSFNHNVQAMVSVIDVAAEREEPALTKNLNQLIKDQQLDTDGDDAIGRRFMNLPNAIDFDPRDDAAIAYVTSGGSDIVLRVEYTADDNVLAGTASQFNIHVGQNPQGLVVRNGARTRGERAPSTGLLVANLISRDVSLVSFDTQAETARLSSTDTPKDPTTQEFKVWKGKRFFNTSTGIWSKEGWGSCQACHFLGLSDNVTWKFAAGPRQTIALDGQYASGDPSDMRALNWTGINDETHDFENNTRGVSGGTGAIRDAVGPIASPSGPAFSSILVEDGASRENHQGLNGSLKFVTGTAAICANGATCPDWNQIDAYIQSIRSPRGKSGIDTAIARGRTVFAEAGCDGCHAGPKWTVSRTFYRPEASSGSPPARVFEANRAAATAMDLSAVNPVLAALIRDATLIAGDDSGGGTPALKRQACNLRDVGSFGAAGGALETRENGSPAQGRNGFNPPSLLGLALGAPYFHNGAAIDLADVFDARFASHTQAGSPGFVLGDDDQAALVAFLASIDETTEPFAIPGDAVACPLDFSAGR